MVTRNSRSGMDWEGGGHGKRAWHDDPSTDPSTDPMTARVMKRANDLRSSRPGLGIPTAADQRAARPSPDDDLSPDEWDEAMAYHDLLQDIREQYD